MLFADESTPLRLEDPYLIAGVPLYFALWFARASRPGQLRWPRALGGFLVLELLAGVVVALVGYCVLHGLTVSPEREAIEWVALSSVATIRILPVLLWLALDPAQPFRFQGPGAGAGSDVGAGATRASKAAKAGSSRSTSNSGSERR